MAGLPADELVRANVGDIPATEDGGVIQVRGKGNKDRRIPVERALIEVLETYLDSRAARPRGFRAGRNGAARRWGWPLGRPPSHCSSAATAIGSPAAHCRTGCWAGSGRLD